MCIMEEQGTQDTLISEGADEDNSTPISEELTEHLLDQGSSCQLINQPNGEIEDLPDINHSDCLDGVEIETVMPEHVQEEEHDEELDRLSSQDCLEGNLEELSLKNHPEIEEIQCFPSNHDDHHDQETELLNQDKIEEPVESEMELDDPIVETVQFPAGSSADTILDDDIKAEVDLEEEEIDLPPTSLSVTTDANTILDTDSSKDDTGDCATLEASDLFKDVKFAVCEDIDDLDKIKKVLTSSGAKFLNYLSDSATHLIADNPDHSNVSEAVDIYEKPVVTSQWVWLSLRANKILPIAPFSPFRDRLFSQVKACPSRLLVPDLSAVWSMITFYGGQFQVNLDSTCTHLITTSVSGEKYEQAASQVDTQKCKIVTPDWVVDSIKNKALCDEERYHPRLLITFNVGKKIMERKMKMMDEKPKSGPEIGDDVVVTKATKSVTMAISTEAVVRKVDPFKPEHIESTQASAVFSVNQTSNVQTHINSVPNSTNSYPSLLASNIRQPQPLQQSKQVQLNSNQSNYVSINRHPSPAQVANVGQQHMHQISHVQMQQLPQPKKQSNPKQTNSTQVHAVKSKNQPKISQAKQTGLKNQAKQQQQQQHQQQQQQQQLVALTQPHFPQDHIMENQQSMMPHSHSVSPSNYHHAQMPQPQMINNQYRPQPNPALAQQQMGNMNQQQTQSQPMHPQQQQPQSQPMHSQQQQPRQVYLTLQQQQQSQQMSQQQQHQMQFINGSTQFVRQQFVTRPLQANMMSPQSQPQQHQQMGPGTPHPGVMPSSPAPVQQMQQIYRQQGQFQQQMQQQRQMQPMQYGGPQGQVPQSGQVYMNQLQQQQPNMIPGQMQRLALQQPPQQVQQPQQNQTMVQQQVNTQQQALINQNQYNHQMQVTHPSDVPSASISPANVPPQYQQVSPRMPVNMIRLANLSPEQQQQLIQQQKMQSSNFVPNMQQSPTVQQQMIRPMGPSTPGQQSPQPQVQMMSPNGTPIQQRMIMRPTMHPQAQQQSYQQMVDASKQQQMSVRPPVQMTAAASGQPQQFVHQQQQIQYIRQRWPGPQNVPNDFSGTPHSQFVNMAGGPRQISPNATGIQVPPQLSPQQQQIWIQQQQARRFALQPRMTRMPMNGPMQPQQHQQPPQSPMHPSMGGMQLPHDHTKVRMSTNTNTSTELVSTSITAVVGGGIDTVIATNAPGTHPMGTNQQVHLVPNSSINTATLDINTQATQSVTATKTILVPTQAPNQMGANQGYQVSIIAGGTSSNSSTSISSSSSSNTTAPSSVVNEKTKTALANLLNNRLNQQNGQQQVLPAPNANLVLRATSSTVISEVRDHVNGVTNSGKPLLGSVVVPQQAPQPGGKATMQASPSTNSVVGVRTHHMMATGSAGGNTAATPAANSMTQQASNIQAIELQMSSVGSHVEMASHAPQSVVHHALPPTPQPVPSQLASPNMVPFASSFHGHSPQSPLVPQTLPMNGPTLSQLAHMTPHPQVTGPRRPGTLPLLPTGTPTGPHHPIHHFGPHQHAQQPHMTALAPGTPAQSPHPNLHPQPQPTVQTPQPAGSQAPPQSQTPTIIQIRFFGHESRQMIPPEFCLIGCVFYIAPNYLEYSNTANLVPGWRRQIEKYGGRLVDNYQSGPNNNVTHVITENMSSSVAKMALQESKRCVSIFWLEDVLCNKRLLPPWRFYHLPLAYGDSKPCRNHIIAISNFDGDERSRLIQLIKRTGALYTSYLSSKNTILICKRLEGTKYEKAMQWRIAIVNLNWLQDILFGHFDALQLSSLPKKYQQFDQFQNASVMLNGAQQNITPSQMLQRDIFRVDYSMVHGLMNSWRAPIKYDNDEFNERLNQSNSDNDTGDKEKQVSNSAEERRDGSDSAELNSNEHAESNAEHSNQATTSSSDSIVESNVEKIAPKRSFDTMVEVNAIGKSVNEDKVEEGVEELHQGQSEMEPLVKKQRIDNELPNCETTQTDNDAIIGKEQLSDANNIASQQTPMEVQNEEQETTEINPQTNATVADALVTVSSENCDSQQQQTNTSEKTCESVSENDPTFNPEPSQLITLTEASTVENTSKPESETGEERATIPVVVAELTETTESQAQFKVPLSNVVPVPIPNKPVLVLFTGINPKDRDQLRSTVESLGGKVVPNPPDCTHLVANCIVPTVKFFCAFARAQHVLHTDWLRECQKAGKFVDEKGFQLRDRISEQLYRVDLARAIPDRNAALFQNTVFLLTRSCVPSPSILQRIIQANGGVAVIKRAPTKGQLVSLEERNLQFVVVTCPTDLHMCDHFFENKIKVVAVEFILNAILRQQLDYEAYSYRSDKNGTSAATSNQTTNGFGLSQLLPY